MSLLLRLNVFRGSAALRAGHSHSKNVAHRKAAVAKKRQAVFQKMGKAVTVAVRVGGADPSSNGMLALAISRAKAANMTKEKIDAAMVAAQTLNEGASEEVVFECVQPGGVAFIVECLTNSRNRTSNTVKHALASHAATLSPVRFLFERRGILRFAAADLERVTDVAFETSADVADIVRADERDDDDEPVSRTLVFCAPAAVHSVAAAFASAGLEPLSLDIGWWPTTKVSLADDDDGLARLHALTDVLDELDDVARVHHNATW